MIPQDFFSIPLHAEIAALLIACALPDKEKRIWLEILPVMNEEEKEELRSNLAQDIHATLKLEADALRKFEQKTQEFVTE